MSARPPVQCLRCVGEPRFRNYPAMTCDICACTICIDCYDQYTLAHPSGVEAPQLNPQSDEGPPVPCHVCGQGRMQFEERALVPWVCAGPAGEHWRRLHHSSAVQAYHAQKEAREQRRQSAHVVFAEFVAADVAGHRPAPSRGPVCPEGASFSFRVTNLGPRQPLLWCALSSSKHVEDRHGGGPGGELATQTITPVARWYAPPSLPAQPADAHVLTVPKGLWASNARVHQLLLYREAELFRQVGPTAAGGLQISVPIPVLRSVPRVVASPERRRGAAKAVHAQGVVSARGAARARHWEASARAAAAAVRGPLLTVSLTHDAHNVSDTDDVALAVDALRKGQHVACGGVGSKIDFMRAVSLSTDFAAVPLLELFCFTTTAAHEHNYAFWAEANARNRAEGRPLYAAPTGDHQEVMAALLAILEQEAGRPAPPMPPARPSGLDAAGQAFSPRHSAHLTAAQGKTPSRPQRPALSAASPMPVGGHEAASPMLVGGHEAASPAPRAPPHQVEGTSQSSQGLLQHPTSPESPRRLRAVPKEVPALDPSSELSFFGPLEGGAVGVWAHSSTPVPIHLVGPHEAVRRARPAVGRVLLGLAQPPAPVDGSGCGQGPLVVLHSVDVLNGDNLRTVERIARRFPRLRWLVSFDAPAWLAQTGSAPNDAARAAASLAECLRFALVPVTSLAYGFMPMLRETAHITEAALRMDSAKGTTRAELIAEAAGGHDATRPMLDTVRRVLQSLPKSFAVVLRQVLLLQEKTLQDRAPPRAKRSRDGHPEGELEAEGSVRAVRRHHSFAVHAIASFVEQQQGIILTSHRLRAVIGEMVSNRIAQLDEGTHSLFVPHHRLVLRVLDEVEGGGSPKGPRSTSPSTSPPQPLLVS